MNPKLRRSAIKSSRPVLLVVPPFHSLTYPALGVSQLKSCLKSEGIDAKAVYSSFDFAERIGLATYKWLSLETSQSMVGEFIFSCSYFGHDQARIDRFVRGCLINSGELAALDGVNSPGEASKLLKRLVAHAIPFAASCARELSKKKPLLVGFSTSFQQTFPSLLIARELKKIDPLLPIAFGGANCSSVMGEELLARFSQIDFVVQGEGESILPDLTKSLITKTPLPEREELLVRGRGKNPGIPRRLPIDLDSMPFPDFFDFFSRLKRSPLKKMMAPGLIMETSRGCWWGQKQHCTFCGLNGEEMAFRKKSPQRSLAEMDFLLKRHPLKRLAMTDNIMPADFYRSLLPELERRRRGEIFYELKSNATKEQVAQLRRSGVLWIQPGIESFGDHVLALMKKGCTGLQNAALLKWCSENGIYASWNHLSGFPGETDSEVRKIVGFMESLHHLQPPSGILVINIDRFSPYFQSPEKFGLSPLVPAVPYRHIFPFEKKSLERLAYRFDSAFLKAKKKGASFAALLAAGKRWKSAYPLSHLAAFPGERILTILDTRPGAVCFSHRLAGADKNIYAFCASPRTENALLKEFPEIPPIKVRGILRNLVKSKLLLRDSDRFLALAVEVSPHYRRLGRIPPHGGFPSKRPELSSGFESLLDLKKYWPQKKMPRKLAALKRRLSKAQAGLDDS